MRDRMRLANVLLWVFVLGLGFESAMRNLNDGLRRAPIRIERDGSTLRLWNNGIVDKVVTHLVSEAGDEAALPQPVLLRNHQGEKYIDFDRLNWCDLEGNPVPAPSPRESLGAVVIEVTVQMR